MDQFYESCAKDQSNIWEYAVCPEDKSNGNMMYVTMNQSYGHDACTEDQSYGTVHVTYVQSQVQSQVRVL